MKTKRKPIRDWCKRKISQWLDLDAIYRQHRRIIQENERLKAQLQAVVDRSFIGLDLGYKDASQIVMLHYSPLTNCWKVIADAKYNKGTYQQLIRGLRDLVQSYNCQYVALDEASLPNIADIKARIPIPSIMLPSLDSQKESLL